MESKDWNNLLIEYIDGTLPPDEQQRVAREIEHNPEVRTHYQQLLELNQVMQRAKSQDPSPQLRTKFEQALQEEINRSASKGRVVPFSSFVIYRVAAVVLLLVLSISVGYWVYQQQEQRRELLALQEELKQTRLMVLQGLNNELSPSARIVSVKVSMQSAQDDEILTALIERMNKDENTNVRLAAVEALAQFSDNATVRTALIDALRTQTDPLVQIALIQLMVKMKVKEAVKPMQDIINEEQTLPAVKDEAHAGIFKLT